VITDFVLHKVSACITCAVVYTTLAAVLMHWKKQLGSNRPSPKQGILVARTFFFI
jgi:hypothetical protein